jgi:hypothetical protein
MKEAKAAWVPLARDALIRVAAVYHATVDYGELAEELQSRSGIRTRQLMHYWIGEVLGVVADTCFARGEPLLSALCVHQDGTIGEGYSSAVLATYGGDVPEDIETAAAEERLKCYRYFGAIIPADGGRPALTKQVVEKRSKQAKLERSRQPRLVCQTCHRTLPATGQCDFCE